MSELFDLFFAGDDVPEPPTDKRAVTTPLPNRTGDEDVTIQRIELGKVYHIPHGVPYHRENSTRGCRYAAEHGYDSIDLDMQLDAEELEQNTHWEKPMRRDEFKDPAKKLDPDTPVKHMTSAQVARLRTPDGYAIRPMSERFALCAVLGLKIRAEAKPDHRWTVAAFKRLKAKADAAGAKVVIATQDNDPKWRERLANARAAGFDTRRLRG